MIYDIFKVNIYGIFKVSFLYVLLACAENFVLHIQTCHRTRLTVYN
jgi:hypothetical protein